MKIAIGVAKGLAFLHTDKRTPLYRTFNASNILLNEVYKNLIIIYQVHFLEERKKENSIEHIIIYSHKRHKTCQTLYSQRCKMLAPFNQIGLLNLIDFVLLVLGWWSTALFWMGIIIPGSWIIFHHSLQPSWVHGYRSVTLHIPA